MRYEESLKDYQTAQIKSLTALAALNFGQKSIEAIGAGYLLFKTAFMVIGGTMSLGELIMINSLLLQLMAPLDHLGANYMQLNQGLVDSKDMFGILKSSQHAAGPEGKVQEQKPALPQLGVMEQKPVGIEFKDVYFGYAPASAVGAVAAGGQGAKHAHSHELPRADSQSKDLVLRGFDLTIKPGSTVAFVGESGCGKSTVTRLLTRAVSASKGQVLLDNQDVARLDPESVRSAVALVAQDATLFNEDVAYNIAYGNLNASVAEVQAAASRAQLDAMTEDMPDGLATKVGDRGSRLSGGQRQRVALARALLKDAPVLVCDEATSALDVYTEARVMEEIRQARKGRTTIVIAHRLSTVVDADEIVVMEQGRVAERGTHDALLAIQGSRYAAMWAAQERETCETGDVKRKAAETEPVLPALEDMIAEAHDDGQCGCGHAH